MAKLLNTTELLAAAADLQIDPSIIEQVIAAQEALAIAVAFKAGVDHTDTSDDGTGLYSAFRLSPGGTPNDMLGGYDPDGEW